MIATGVHWVLTLFVTFQRGAAKVRSSAAVDRQEHVVGTSIVATKLVLIDKIVMLIL
jgi:hypothetical protein